VLVAANALDEPRPVVLAAGKAVVAVETELLSFSGMAPPA
jgi:hypothetical protein